MGYLSPHSEEQTPFLLVVVPGITVLPIDVALITPHGEFVFRRYRIGDHYASVIDSAVPASRDAVVHLKFKIRRSAIAPDDKRVALDDGFGSNFTHHVAVFHAPITWIALPTTQRLAIEDRTEAWLIAA